MLVLHHVRPTGIAAGRGSLRQMIRITIAAHSTTVAMTIAPPVRLWETAGMMILFAAALGA
jgi:hypothetical protein